MTKMAKPNVVIIGGGSGSVALLSGLKDISPELTVLLSMADNGGSSGLLRDEIGALPPGDIRKCLLELAGNAEMSRVFQYRFEKGSLAGHSFGNLFLSAAEKATGDFSEAVELAGKALEVTGRVLPITTDHVTLVATDSRGREVRGQTDIDRGPHHFDHPDIRLEPHGNLTPEGKQAIEAADLIVLAPGSVYGSLAAVLLVRGLAEALAAAKAKKVFVCNLVTEIGRSDGMKVHNFAAEAERFLGGKVRLDYVLYNTHFPDNDMLERYAKKGDEWVTFDETVLTNQHYMAIGGNFLSAKPWKPTAKVDLLPRTFIRHDGPETAKVLQKIYEGRLPARPAKTVPPFAVLFDMDGVLIETEEAHVRAHKKIAERHGFTDEQVMTAFSKGGSLRQYYAAMQTLHPFDMSFDDFADEVLDAVFADLEQHVKGSDPALVALLEALRRRGVPFAIGTSALKRSTLRKLKLIELHDEFDILVTSDDVKNHKPHPEVYLTAAQKVGVEPSKCIVVEDSSSGIDAGRAAGMKVIAFGKYSPLGVGFEKADLVIHDFKELSYEKLLKLVTSKA